MKVYVYSDLVFEKKTPTPLNQGDFWYVARITWNDTNQEVCGVTSAGPTGCDTGTVGTGIFVTKKYPAPAL